MRYVRFIREYSKQLQIQSTLVFQSMQLLKIDLIFFGLKIHILQRIFLTFIAPWKNSVKSFNLNKSKLLNIPAIL